MPEYLTVALRLLALEELVEAQAIRIRKLEDLVHELADAAATAATTAVALYAQQHTRIDGLKEDMVSLDDRVKLNEVFAEYNAANIVELTDRLDAMD